jgi:hypothetical protein
LAEKNATTNMHAIAEAAGPGSEQGPAVPGGGADHPRGHTVDLCAAGDLAPWVPGLLTFFDWNR